MNTQRHRVPNMMGNPIHAVFWNQAGFRDSCPRTRIEDPQSDLNTGGQAVYEAQKDRMQKRPHGDAEVTSWREQTTRLEFNPIGDG